MRLPPFALRLPQMSDRPSPPPHRPEIAAGPASPTMLSALLSPDSALLLLAAATTAISLVYSRQQSVVGPQAVIWTLRAAILALLLRHLAIVMPILLLATAVRLTTPPYRRIAGKLASALWITAFLAYIFVGLVWLPLHFASTSTSTSTSISAGHQRRSKQYHPSYATLTTNTGDLEAASAHLPIRWLNRQAHVNACKFNALSQVVAAPPSTSVSTAAQQHVHRGPTAQTGRYHLGLADVAATLRTCPANSELLAQFRHAGNVDVGDGVAASAAVLVPLFSHLAAGLIGLEQVDTGARADLLEAITPVLSALTHLAPALQYQDPAYWHPTAHASLHYLHASAFYGSSHPASLPLRLLRPLFQGLYTLLYSILGDPELWRAAVVLEHTVVDLAQEYQNQFAELAPTQQEIRRELAVLEAAQVFASSVTTSQDGSGSVGASAGTKVAVAEAVETQAAKLLTTAFRKAASAYLATQFDPRLSAVNATLDRLRRDAPVGSHAQVLKTRDFGPGGFVARLRRVEANVGARISMREPAVVTVVTDSREGHGLDVEKVEE